MKETKNARVFKVTFYGATHTKGSRMKIYDQRFKTAKWLDFSYDYTNGTDQVADYLRSIGIKPLFKGEFDTKSDVIISDNFEVMLQWNEAI